jgi:hypothetical protein
MVEKLVGKITYFFDMSGTAMIKLTDTLMIGDEIHVVGSSSNFKQKLEILQKNDGNISIAKAGEDIAIKVSQPVQEGDSVYKIRDLL